MRAFHKFVVLGLVELARPEGQEASMVCATMILKKQIIREQNSQKTT
jgi:hypothetical protein